MRVRLSKERSEGERSEPQRSASEAGAAAESASRPDPEVVAKPKRRTYTVDHKQSILEEAGIAAATPGVLGALLRRDGLYSSLLATWRREGDQGIREALTPAAPFGLALLRLEPRSRTGVSALDIAAWKIQGRDPWVGSSDEQRKCTLQSIDKNGRFLILPWVRVKGLASKILALSDRPMLHDWQSRYGYRPLLLETLVDTNYFRGTYYRAANWLQAAIACSREFGDENADHE